MRTALRRWVVDRNRWEQRGAVALVMALVTCFVVIPLGAMTIDLGMQRIARNDAQALADTAALDAVRRLSPTATDASVTAAAWSSMESDSGAIGTGPSVTGKVGYIAPGVTWESANGLGCDGTFSNAYFSTTVPTGTAPNAALVIVRNTVNFGLARAMGSDSGPVCRSAIAGVSDQSACFSVDSYAAQLAAGNSAVLGPLLRLLGSGLDVSAVSSSGIAQTNVGLLDFLTALQASVGVGRLQDVLATQVTALQVLTAEVTALNRSGATAQAAVDVLQQQLIANLGRLPFNLPFRLDSILNVTQGLDSALGAHVNALDLAMASLFLANGQNALAVSAGTSTGVADLHASLKVIQQPQITCGPVGSVARTSQVDLSAQGSIIGGNLVSSLVSAVSAGLSLVTCLTSVVTGHCQWIDASVGSFSVDVQLASGSGRLSQITCAGTEATGLTIQASGALAPIEIDLPVTISYVDKNIYTGTTTTSSVTLTTAITTTPGQPSATSITFVLPTDYGKAKPGPAGSLSLDHLSVNSAITGTPPPGLLGVLLPTANGLVNAVNSVLQGIEQAVISPLLDHVTSLLRSLVGLDLAGSTFTAQPRALCGGPQLVG